MRFPRQWWIVASFLSALSPAGLQAQDPVLIREVVSREYGIHVGGVEITPQKEIVSREVSFHVENGAASREVVSREYDVLVDNPGVPPAVNDVAVTLSPTGESMALDWSASNPWAVHDIQWFDIYLSDSGPITDITGLTSSRRVGGSVTQATLDGLEAFTDHYFVIVAVDGLGNRLTTVPGKAAYVLMPEVASREVSLFVGQEPDPPYKQVVSREYDVCVDAPGAPPAIGNVVVSLNAVGDTATLDWSSYNQWAVGDVQHFEIYLSDAGPFEDITSMTPFASIGGGSTGIRLTGLAQNIDHYFAVVPVDALGNRIPAVSYSAGYVLMPEVVSREVSLFIGQESVPPYREMVSREVSVVVSDGTTPAPVTGIESGFSAVTSVGLFGAIDLDWTTYNELLQRDVSRYRVYLSDIYFEDVTGMEPHSYVQTGRQTATIDGFPSAAIRYVAVVAEDASGNFDPVVRAHSVQASYLPYFRFFDDTVTVHEGEVAEIPVILEGLVRTGRYQLASDSAHVFNGSSGDYVDAPVPLEFRFNPSLGASEGNVQIPIIRDGVAEPDEELVLLIVNPNKGATTVVASIRVIIKDEPGFSTAVWHPEVQTIAPPIGAADNRIGVVLSPEPAGAQWRLEGEPFWRDPGPLNLVTGLTNGIHRVEYKPVAGHGLPAFPEGDPENPFDDGPSPNGHEFFGAEATHLFMTEYPPLLGNPGGTLRVELRPAGIAAAPDESSRAQWRLVGDAVWRNSGASVPLPVGKHLIEFKDSVAGYHAPVPRSALVEDGVQTFVECRYEAQEETPAGIAALPFHGATGSGQVNEAPQSFIGQIETSQGYGSGVAVTTHTVLTAARVVFDPDRLAGAASIAWFHQRHADYGPDLQDDHIPESRHPRGYKLLTSYASMRRDEVSAGGARALPGDAASDQKDLAVLYFTPQNGEFENFKSARGGFSGFLADFSMVNRPNPWLAGALEKKLCGYPLSGIPVEARGLMHGGGISTLACDSYGGQLYRSSSVGGLPGMEGAPLFVKHPNGSFYPAAIYLGQNEGAMFRALDRYAAAAIYLAEWEVVRYPFRSASGGGARYSVQWSEDDPTGGFLFVDFRPSQGSWRILDPSNSEVLSDWFSPKARIAVGAGVYAIEYQAVTGFTSPPVQLVMASAGLTAVPAALSYRRTFAGWAASYFSPMELENPLISSPESRINGLPNVVAFGFGLEPGSTLRPVARPETGQPGLPRVSIDSSTRPATITVDFLRRSDALAPQLHYVVELADNPAGPWEDEQSSPVTTTIDEEWTHVRLVTAPVAEAGRKFVRIRVTEETE